MQKITLNLDPVHFPQINRRYTPDQIKDQLVKMCLKLKIEVNEANLHSMAANLESDLEHMFLVN